MNIDICRASKDVFDKDTNPLVPDVKKPHQSRKENGAENDPGIFEEINKGKMSEELGPAIFSQLAKVAMKQCPEESKNPVVVNKILGLKIPANCGGVCVPIINEAVAKNRKITPFHEREAIG